MKYDHSDQIRQGKEIRVHKAHVVDIVVNPEVIERNQQQQANRPKRKRRIDYAKKIMNDPFIMNV